MKRRRNTLKTFLLLPLLVAAASAARAQGFDYDGYEPRTLAELTAKYTDDKKLNDPKAGDGSSIFGASFPSRVRVRYTGESRRIPDARKRLITDWVQTHGMDSRLVELFEDEWKFAEGGVEHWLPVQKQVASYFGRELKKGDEVDLYVVIAGGRKAAGKWDWLILVNEFEKAGPPKPAG